MTNIQAAMGLAQVESKKFYRKNEIMNFIKIIFQLQIYFFQPRKY